MLAADRLLGNNGEILCQTQLPHVFLVLMALRRIWVGNIITCPKWQQYGVFEYTDARRLRVYGFLLSWGQSRTNVASSAVIYFLGHGNTPSIMALAEAWRLEVE